MNNTKIEWCDKTWNPVTGCLHGCPYCYARSIVKRFGRPLASPNCYSYSVGLYQLDKPDMKILYKKGDKPGINPYPQGFKPTFHRYRLCEPMDNKNGSVVFVCSMADLFGEWVPDNWIFQVLKAAMNAPQHKYFFLTKYPERYMKIFRSRPFDDDYGTWILPKGFWYGYSASTQKDLDSRDIYTAGIKNLFVSIEPMQEEIILNGEKFGWVIVGAESGNRKAKILPKWEWLEGIVCYCREYDIPLFMKNSLAPIWEGPLIQQFPEGITLSKKGGL